MRLQATLVVNKKEGPFFSITDAVLNANVGDRVYVQVRGGLHAYWYRAADDI